jgi:ERCC4-type nuclease
VSERLHILIDTREQRPWSFDPARADVSVQTLATGDYALSGDVGFAIERKSLDDFLGSIGSEWSRFRREIDRMAGWSARVVIVEATYTDCVFRATVGGEIRAPQHSHVRMTPAFIAKRVAQLMLAGVCVMFADDRGAASALALQIFAERRGKGER